MAIYDINGLPIKCIKGIAHRGYSATAPENTIPAYELAVTSGYKYGECDISFTSDGIPMLLHDATIDRTSNGSGTLSQMTYAQVRQYDFGSWKSAEYTGTVIPTLAEFLDFCAESGMHPYLELKNNATYSQAQIEGIVDLVETYGLTGKCTYISFSLTYLGYVKAYDSKARLGYVVSSISSSTITSAQGLQTGENEVFIDSSSYDSSAIELCANADIPLEIWTLNDVSSASSLNDYISGATANSGSPSSLLQYQDSASVDGTKVETVYRIDGAVL